MDSNYCTNLVLSLVLLGIDNAELDVACSYLTVSDQYEPLYSYLTVIDQYEPRYIWQHFC